jgi:hypothetical protein
MGMEKPAEMSGVFLVNKIIFSLKRHLGAFFYGFFSDLCLFWSNNDAGLKEEKNYVYCSEEYRYIIHRS